MPSDSRTGGLNLNWANLTLLVAALGGLFWGRSALQTPRPPEGKIQENKALGDQKVQMRLWADPFEAVEHGSNLLTTKKGPEKHTPLTNSLVKITDANLNPESTEEKPDALSISSDSFEHLKWQISWHVDELQPTQSESNKSILVLAVFVPGGPYGEDAEVRRRSRYAVLSALGLAGFASSDEQHVGVLKLPWHECSALRRFVRTSPGQVLPLPYTENSQMSLTAPYEWFQRSELRPAILGSHCQFVLVWWLNADLFADYPMQRLAQLLQATLGPETKSQVRFKVLDPRLHDIINELNVLQQREQNLGRPLTAKETSIYKALQNVEMYSSWATTADTLLVPGESDRPRSKIREKLQQRYGVILHNATCTDNILASNLLAELQRRGIDPIKRREHVALVSEWDTFYGRSLALTFAAEVYRQQHGLSFSKAVSLLQSNSFLWPPNILRFTYLRGVDGLVPADAKEKRADAKKPAPALEEQERPFGPSQFDYMPRLAGELLERRHELRKMRSDLRAIGVLGSDVYDKLLLMQSFKQNIPGALFFTTDMDAFLLHSSQQSWARNTIIASSFDLELGEQLQAEVPPFRDSYQTGQFLATLVALGREPPSLLTNIQPRLFEIGRDQADVLDGLPGPNASLEDQKLYADRPFRIEKGDLVRSLLVLILLIAMLAFFFSHDLGALNFKRWFNRRIPSHKPADALEENEYRRRRVYRWILFLVFVSFGILIYFIIQEHYERAGEPFTLVGGISLWPTELLRLSAFWVAVFFVAKGRYDLRMNRLVVQQELMGLEQQTETKPNCWKRLCAWGSEQRLYWWDAQEASGASDVRSVWQQYTLIGLLGKRFLRLLFVTAVYILLAVLLFTHIGFPSRPYRSPSSSTIDFIVLFLSVGAQLVLSVYVVDVVVLCREFFNRLHKQKGLTWPDAALNYYRTQRWGDPHNPSQAEESGKEWLYLQLVARRASAVDRLIVYPFIVLLLMILARHPYFDNFDWPLSLILVLGLNLIYTIYCAIVLRRTAHRARQNVIDHLQNQLAKSRSAGNDNLVDFLEGTIEEVRSLNTGPFAPWYEQSAVRAILLPVGGAGALSLLDFLPI